MEKQNIQAQKSTVEFTPMILLCYFLGIFGIHRFYADRIGTGVLMLLTLGGFGLWTMVDFVMIATGYFKDGNGRVIKS